MRVIKSILFAFISAVCAFSQTGRLDSGNINGPAFGFYWETRLEPASPALAQNLGMKTVETKDSNFQILGLDRIWMDRARRVYFGYRVLVNAWRGVGPHFAVAFQPLVLTPELAQSARMDNPESWKQLPIGRPEGQTVQFSDVIAIDLMTNPGTGQKIVDYISIQERHQPTFNNPVPREFSYVAGTPRDFRVEDATLHIREPHLSINGKADASSRADVIGSTVWLYVPDKGRFVLSLTPRPGFQKTGEVRGTSLSFKVGGDTFAVSSAVRIAPGDAPFNLYVLHEPAWRPAETSGFAIGQ